MVWHFKIGKGIIGLFKLTWCIATQVTKDDTASFSGKRNTERKNDQVGYCSISNMSDMQKKLSQRYIKNISVWEHSPFSGI